jgi:thiol-disulfide isomerase/thioredoxin
MTHAARLFSGPAGRRLFLALLLAVVVLFPAACGGSEPPKKAQSQAAFAPLDAKGVEALKAETRGRVLLLCFWTTWCPSCRQEMGELAKIRSAYKPEDLRVVAVSLDENVGALKSFFQSEPPVEVFFGGAALGGAYGIDAIPHLIIFGRDGRQAFNKPGAYPFAMLDGIIAGLAKE